MYEPDKCLSLLPAFIQKACQEAIPKERNLLEMKVRIGRPLMVYTDCGEVIITCGPEKTPFIMDKPRIQETLHYLCRDSLYAYEDDIKRGYFTLEGGHRVGVAGKAVLETDGTIRNMKYIGYLTIRFAHEKKGVADEILSTLYNGERLYNTLLIAPPGCGKTTMLRDMVRQVSNGNRYGKGRSVGLLDERSELAGSYLGEAQNDVGERTDVLYGCRKAEGIMLLIRSMSPKVIAVDEIGGEEDLKALASAAHCGVSILATIHGDSLEDLLRRPLFKRMYEEGLFTRFIELHKSGQEFVCEVRNNEIFM